jgi:hypothetical protein
MKFHGNPSSRTGVFHADGQTDLTKLTVAFRNFAKAPKKSFMCVTFQDTKYGYRNM